MVLRIFYAFIILLTGYLGFQVFGLYTARHALERVPMEYTIGSEDADLTIVKFMDYSCIYCQQMHPVILEAITLDGHARLAPRPLLSTDPDGSSAAYIFYAAAMQGKAVQAHSYLMENGVDLTRERLPEIAAALEINTEKFLEDIDSKAVDKLIRANMRHFSRLGGFATPTFFIGPDIMYMADNDMPTSGDFLKIFKEARSLKP